MNVRKPYETQDPLGHFDTYSTSHAVHSIKNGFQVPARPFQHRDYRHDDDTDKSLELCGPEALADVLQPQ
jgi:hypothetical protein